MITFSDESSTHRIIITALEYGVSRAPATWCIRYRWQVTHNSVICVEAARRDAHQCTCRACRIINIWSYTIAIMHRRKKWKPKHESPTRPIWDFWFSNAGSTHFITFMLSEMSVWAELCRLTHISVVQHMLYILFKKFTARHKQEKLTLDIINLV